MSCTFRGLYFGSPLPQLSLPAVRSPWIQEDMPTQTPWFPSGLAHPLAVLSHSPPTMKYHVILYHLFFRIKSSFSPNSQGFCNPASSPTLLSLLSPCTQSYSNVCTPSLCSLNKLYHFSPLGLPSAPNVLHPTLIAVLANSSSSLKPQVSCHLPTFPEPFLL